ncbi:rRNA maturation protein Nop10 [Mesorhizobium robiniae]|uniref:rRNA maturation protein Nop10 n=1 Tax=Mesorhizobium robiniae TaxID=559315 RepID=A0ABV2GVM0_9HYPH
MTERTCVRVALLAPLVVSGLALSGCMGSPTYGTDKSASAQLAGDLTSAFSVVPKNKDRIDYKPRPELVKPAPGQKELPPPQDSIATASADWPESPEQRRARLRADATLHQDDPAYQAQIVDDVQTDPTAIKTAMAQSGSSHPPAWSPADSDKGRAAEVKRRLAEAKQGDPNTRRYLSEPPVQYRAAADTAPTGDLGEDEYKKERRLKKEAAAKNKSGGMFDWLPW